MHRLARFDISTRYADPRLRFVVELAFGALCAGAMILLRSGASLVAPTSGPFALVYPTVLVAVLYGHLRAGIIALLLSFSWAWYFVLPYQRSFAFQDPTDPPRVAINFIACVIILVFAESFRRAVRISNAQIEAAAQRRLTLLAELEHRTKNNFALVASLLEIQKRKHADPHVVEALEDASRRVMTFADAYSNLAEEQAEGSEVAMKPYLERLIERVAGASFGERVTVRHAISNLSLPRERGVGIGLYLNEAIANCAKYAFPDGRAGSVEIIFAPHEGGWQLTVADDGVGENGVCSNTSSGLGTQLMEAFAEQAGATYQICLNPKGSKAILRG